MPKTKRQIKLGAFLMQTGHHIAAWRHPGAQADAGSNFRHYVELAKKAEAAKFDAIFLADSVGVRSSQLESLSRTARSDHFEPLTL
ncbi:MAG: nitrilotriacetate monooxygenase, partial [Rhodoferax sp.]|nr:nitrilotriacetate monooxygenase [Rhodoferax sp.]